MIEVDGERGREREKDRQRESEGRWRERGRERFGYSVRMHEQDMNRRGSQQKRARVTIVINATNKQTN